MKKGSLVVVLKTFASSPTDSYTAKFVKWIPIADEETIYTVRFVGVNALGQVYVFFEEEVIGYMENNENDEIGIAIKYVREICPSISSEEIEQMSNTSLSPKPAPLYKPALEPEFA